MITRHRTFRVALFAIVALGCSGAAAEQKEPEELTKVRVSFRKHLSWGPIMIAQAEGYFRDEGLDVEFVSQQRPTEALVALIAGDIDVTPGPLHAGVLSSIARGAPVRIVAGQGALTADGCTYFGIVLRKGIDTVGGKPRIRRMRTGSDGASRFLVDQMLMQRKVVLKDIETLHLPDAIVSSAIENGSLDAVAVSEPGLSRLKKIGTMWLAGEDVAPDFQWAVILFGDRLTNKDRETGERFLRAYQRGVAQYLKGKTDRNVAIIADATGDTPEHTKEVCWPHFDSDLRVNWASIAAYEAWAIGEKLMPVSVTRDQALDSLFLNTSRANAAGMP